MTKTIKVSDYTYEKIKDQLETEEKINITNMYMVRTYSAGVFMGKLENQSEDGKKVTLSNARRMWHWSGAASLSQLATEGVSNPEDCKFPCTVNEVILTEVIEMIPMTKKAIKSINSVKVWSA